MSWYRSSRGLWCACFQAYQPDDGNGCPAYPCPEDAQLSEMFSPLEGRAMPERIQLRRTKGWRKPEGAIIVSRPSKWGNPWRIVVDGKWHKVRHATEDRIAGQFVIPEYARETATRMFYSDLVNGRLPYGLDDVERELRGRDLCCWCPPTPLNPNGSLNWLGLQCHGEVLLELAAGD